MFRQRPKCFLAEPMPPHILIVEDDSATRAALALTFQTAGYATNEAENGRAALEQLRSGEPPCLILLDLMMPVMTGWQFLAERRKDPALVAVPVVVFTAAGGYDDSMLRGLGADDVIRKPADADQLLAAVGRRCPAPAAWTA